MMHAHLDPTIVTMLTHIASPLEPRRLCRAQHALHVAQENRNVACGLTIRYQSMNVKPVAGKTIVRGVVR